MTSDGEACWITNCVENTLKGALRALRDRQIDNPKRKRRIVQIDETILDEERLKGMLDA